MHQTYHIEALSPDRDGKPVQVVQRATVRSGQQDAVERRAIRLLQRSQLPQWNLGPVEIVRVVDGAGTELFRWSVWEELAAPTGR